MSNDNKPAWDSSRLRAEMAAADVTGGKLATLIGKSPNTISSYVTGRVPPTVAVLAEIAVALGCKVRDLIAKEDAT